MMPPRPIEQVIQDIVQEEWGRILASLVASIGDFQLAEDCLQDAVVSALAAWPNAMPKSPAAWLITTARRKAIDRLRRDQNFVSKRAELAYIAKLEQDEVKQEKDDTIIKDERLCMMFTCCHPAIEEKARIALTLRTLGGLSTEDIANAFLDKPEAMAQRIVRAKQKIKSAKIPYQIPEEDMLPDRIGSVLKVIYLIFNEGYSARAGTSLVRVSLSAEAIRLARIMAKLMPDIPEISGLLALMLLNDARRYARLNADGGFVPLEEQNRNKWDQAQISEGIDLVKATLPRGAVGPYQLQAAISAVHSQAAHWNDTDWPQIAALYEVLYLVQSSPVVRINQAVAISYANSPQEGLDMLAGLEMSKSLERYQPFFAARADMRMRAFQTAGALDDFNRAIDLSSNDQERMYLMGKARGLSGQ